MPVAGCTVHGEARGYPSETSPGKGGNDNSGGGGRIAIYTCNNQFPPGNITVAGGQGWVSGSNNGHGQAGTKVVPAGGIAIAQDPADQYVLAGGQATFTVVVEGVGPIDYYWLKDGIPLFDGGNISGASTATLTINPVSAADEGPYSVMVMGACGDVTSAAARLAIVTPWQIAGAVSVKTHGTAGTFPIDLLAGHTECRSNGPTRVEVTFNQPITLATGTPADVAITTGTVTAVAADGAVLTVTLQNGSVPTPSVTTMSFPGVKDAMGYRAVDKQLCIRTLQGDANNANNAVNTFDLLVVRNRLNQPVTSANFRNDITADGNINTFDLLGVRNKMGQTVGPCP